MNTVNAVLTKMHDVVLAPVAGSPLLALILVSAVTGVAMTWVFGKTSSQKSLGMAADRARALLLGMKLFRDDARVVLGYQLQLFKAIGLRLAHSLPPMLALIVPLSVLLIQLAVRYEHRPLASGERTVVELQLDAERWESFRDVTLDVPDGVVVETPPLRDEQLHTVYWRIRVDEPPETPLRWGLHGKGVEQPLAAAANVERLCVVDPRRPGAGLADRLMHPGSPGFAPNTPVTGIVVHYPRRVTRVFGFDVPWWVTFLVVSMVTALIVRPFFKVRF